VALTVTKLRDFVRDPRETKEVLKGKMLMCDLDAKLGLGYVGSVSYPMYGMMPPLIAIYRW
jgi:hypothetical protein